MRIGPYQLVQYCVNDYKFSQLHCKNTLLIFIIYWQHAHLSVTLDERLWICFYNPEIYLINLN